MLRTMLCTLVLMVNVSHANESIGLNALKSSDVTVDSGTQQVITRGEVVKENGLGCEYHDKMQTARTLVIQRKFDQANQLADEVIKGFETNYVKKEGVFLTFLNKEAFERYCSGSGKNDPVYWLDWSYREAFFLKAFIANEQKKRELAIQILDRLISSISPEDPEAYCEKGNAFNAEGRLTEGLEQYQHAYALSKKSASYKTYAAAALRGMGFAYTDLGRLQEAEDAYNESLKLEPNNAVALNELRYIDSVKKRMGEASTTK
jgi:tetratricopeptide (TPR) repeat protein